MIKYKTLSIQWLGHDGFLIKTETGKSICIDPFKVKKYIQEVDVIVCTHEHFDHCHPDDIKKFVGKKTEIIAIPMAQDNLKNIKAEKIHYVEPGESLDIKEMNFSFVPAYNVNKFRAPNHPFHPKEDGKIGVIIELDGHKVYHTGDSDFIPEMNEITTDVALIPVSGTYVMTVDEAVESVKAINPKLAVPMHYGSIIGDETMAKEFKSKASCPVEIPNIE